MSEPDDGLQGPYMTILNLTTSEHLNLYKKVTIMLPGSDRYELTMSEWNNIYQESEDYVSTFGFKGAFQIATDRYASHVPTKFDNVKSSYPSITQSIMNS